MANRNLTDRSTVLGVRVDTDGNAIVPAVTHYSHFQTAFNLSYELQIPVFPQFHYQMRLNFAYNLKANSSFEPNNQRK